MAMDSAGNVYIGDNYNNAIRVVSPVGTNWVVTTLWDNVTLTSQDVYNQISVAVDSADNVYVVNRTDNLIRQISLVGTNWVMTPVAGSAWNSGFADGAGNAAQFNNPMGTAVDNNGNLFVADAGNNAIRKVSPVGTNWVVTTVVGSRVSIGNADGIGCEALLNIPKGVAVDGAGNVYVADAGNSTIRKVSSVGVVTTLAGNAAPFTDPGGVAVDGAGNVYVADTYNQVIRKVSPVGTNWVVTTPTMGGGFSTPTSLAIDSAGNLFVTDSASHTLSKVSPDGTNWVVTSLLSNNGISLNGNIIGPTGVAVDSVGNIYVALSDANASRSIKGTPGAVIQKATITVQTNPSGNGIVSGGGPNVVGSIVQISATPEMCWEFTNWDDGNTQNPRTITVPATNFTYTANLRFPQQLLPITVQSSPVNSGTVSGGGSYPCGSQQTITANGNSSWTFAGWSDGNYDNPRTVTVQTNNATYTANFSWASAKDYVKLTETYQDKLACDPANGCAPYPTGSFTINAVLFIGAGLNATNLNQNTHVEIDFYAGPSGNLLSSIIPAIWSFPATVGDDPHYKPNATKITIPVLSYTFLPDGSDNPYAYSATVGTATFVFRKTQTTLTITSKAGQDIHGNYLGPFLDADSFINTNTPGPVNDTISATITIGDYSEAFTNIVITGTFTEVYKDGSDGSSYPVDTVKIKGKSQ